MRHDHEELLKADLLQGAHFVLMLIPVLKEIFNKDDSGLSLITYVQDKNNNNKKNDTKVQTWRQSLQKSDVFTLLQAANLCVWRERTHRLSKNASTICFLMGLLARAGMLFRSSLLQRDMTAPLLKPVNLQNMKHY